MLWVQAGVQLISLPSKRLGLYTTAAATIIARSDSNGEDLEAFAGAGMHLTQRIQVQLWSLLCNTCSMHTYGFPCSRLTWTGSMCLFLSNLLAVWGGILGSTKVVSCCILCLSGFEYPM